MSLLRLGWLLARRQRELGMITALAVLALTVATGALLTVLGGLQAFTARAGGDPDDLYMVLAQVATIILVVPVMTLGGAAARLAISRRNARLAALRLAGATTRQIGTLTLVEAAAQALAGALLGTVLYEIALPGVALLNFQGRSFDWAELQLGPLALLGAVAAIVIIATGSAAISLAGVAVSPLGVANRVSPKALSALRLALAIGAFAVWAVASGLQDVTVIMVSFAICLGVLGVVGPFVLWCVGKIGARLARTAPQLLATRRLSDDPRGAWRAVGGVALATFIAGIACIAPSLPQDTESYPTINTDIFTGACVTLIISVLLAATSTGVNQATRALDQAPSFRLLHLAGTEPAVLRRARLTETALPLGWAVGTAAVAALLLIAPLGMETLTGNWYGPTLFLGAVIGSVTLMLGAVRLTEPLVDSAVAAPN